MKQAGGNSPAIERRKPTTTGPSTCQGPGKRISPRVFLFTPATQTTLRRLPQQSQLSLNRYRIRTFAQAGTAAGPTSILKINPALLAQGGLDPALEAPAAKDMLNRHLSELFLPVNIDQPGLKVMNIDPPVLCVHNFLTDAECQNLVDSAAASNELKQSEVGGYATGGMGVAGNVRTSSTLAMTSEMLSRHPALRASLDVLLDRVTKLVKVGLPPDSSSAFTRPTTPGQFSYELPQVANYQPGQHFLTHEDAFPVNAALSKGYQRRATLLVYLNDVPQGGATYFDHLGFGVQPQRGKALLFFPSFASGAPDHRTLHTAQDAVDEKWVSQLWISCGLRRPAPQSVQVPTKGGATSDNKKKKKKR